MKMTKRILAILLTFCMLATTLCLPAFAADTAALSEKTATADAIKALLEGDYALTSHSGGVVSSQTVIYMGDNCYRAQGACASGGGVNAYCRFLEDEGFVPYVDKGGNSFVSKHLGASTARNQTYSDGTYLVTVFWDTGNDLLTVTMEPLPADETLKAEYLSVFTPTATEKVCEPAVIQLGLDVNGAYSGSAAKDIRSGMGYVFRLSDGSFVIFDGGSDNASAPGGGDAGLGTTVVRKVVYRLLSILNTYAVDKNDIRISAWLITHPHSDHYKIFEQVVTEMYTPTNSYYTEYANITIERIITNYPDYDQLDNCTTSKNANGACDKLTVAGLATRRAALATCEENGAFLYKAHAGQTYYLADAELAILYTEEIAPSPSGNAGCSCESGDQSENNRLSVVSQLTLPVDGYDVKFMITGDSEGSSIAHVNGLYGTELKSDFVQAPHHGNNDTQTSALTTFYATNVQAPYLMVPTSDDWWAGIAINSSDASKVTSLITNGYSKAYSKTTGVTTFVAGDVSHEYALTVTSGTLTATEIVLLWCRDDIERYVQEDTNYKLLGDLTLDEPSDEENVTKIATAADLLAIAKDLTGSYKLTQDITVDSQNVTLPNGTANYIIAGTFAGTLDGDGHTITFADEFELKASASVLFQFVGGCTVKNLNIGSATTPVDVTVISHSGGRNQGVLAQKFSGTSDAPTTISNVHIYVNGDLSGADQGTSTANLNFGCFLGKTNDANSVLVVENCTANGVVDSSTLTTGIGHYIGFLGSFTGASATFKNCTNNVAITCAASSKVKVAGIVGVCNSSSGALTIENCVNNANLSGIANVAGMVAVPSTGTITIKNCVNLGSITGAESTVGSMIAVADVATVTDCLNFGKINNGGTYLSVTQTNKGAGVRIVDDGKGTGLRFKFTMDVDSIAALNMLSGKYGADNVEVGAIILPTDLLRDGEDLTAENYSNAHIMACNASDVTGGYYYASLVNLFENHYNWAYSCQSFYRFRTSADSEWITVYAGNTLSRTIAAVADAFLADQSIDWSKYTSEQLALVNAYAVAND